MFDPVIKWSGSKRSQSERIVSFFPESYNTYYEPFIGGGAVLYAADPKKAICGDVCSPLIALWNEIKNHPYELAQSYRERWNRLKNEGYTAYYEIRDDFNQTKSPQDLLFLTRTCVNGLIRFNAAGEFNNSLHHSRPGISPDRLETIIHLWSERIQGTTFIADDYRNTTSTAQPGDIVYLDPPYFHTKGRYFGTIDYDGFLEYLQDLNKRGIKYILSYDGVRGEKNYVVDLPQELYVRHEFILSGSSSFKKVMDKENLKVYESLYMNF